MDSSGVGEEHESTAQSASQRKAHGHTATRCLGFSGRFDGHPVAEAPSGLTHRAVFPKRGVRSCHFTDMTPGEKNQFW